MRRAEHRSYEGDVSSAWVSQGLLCQHRRQHRHLILDFFSSVGDAALAVRLAPSSYCI